MSNFSFYVLAVLAALGCQLCLVNSVCNECQPLNDAACINETSFHLCFGSSTPNTDQTFTCPDGLVCSQQPNICFQRSETPASCGDTDSCGLCNSDYVFACTSLTTFSLCYGATTPSTTNGTCPDGRFCDASSSNICVTTVTDDSIICHLT
ncbi:uncharacterized protein LOC133844551 [Drosophila sulfurigaster albostrigata]|uniref:uncharacterized protein LOC133844551 n=1 Tax=Drosophila sulfurigaster albostrigata TaxID=89887 RepID=UPI002D21881F|nr:uncharacterized protein LOC133844551 [Drosophila sulfurigaster albostrigata]